MGEWWEAGYLGEEIASQPSGSYDEGAPVWAFVFSSKEVFEEWLEGEPEEEDLVVAPAQEDGKKERQRRERVDENGSVAAPGLLRWFRRELAEPRRRRGVISKGRRRRRGLR